METTQLRRFIYGILITMSVGVTTARIIGVENVYDSSRYRIYPERWPSKFPEPSPTFGSNDRSRWATVKQLVEKGTFVIGERNLEKAEKDVPGTRLGRYDDGILFKTQTYRTIDVVMNPETGKFYSSKPPLFTVIVAGEYWLLYHFLNWNLEDERWPVTCTILLTFNVLPLLIMLILLTRLLDEYCTTDWARVFILAAACLGTFLTTFAVTLNNHTPAAFCAFFAIYPLLRGRAREDRPFTKFELLISGFFAGLTLCLDLPAAALTAALGAVILLRSPRGLICYVPAALIAPAVMLWLNYLAIGDWSPAYAKFGGPWYKYVGSHWAKPEQEPAKAIGIDFLSEPKSTYAFHMIVGHHGLFSLTPIWIFALLGMLLWKRRTLPSWVAPLTFLVTAVVLAFYVVRTNNYGGYTAGPRWQYWLTPLFLIVMIPIVDACANRAWLRRLSYLFLGVSVFSACYTVWNPWRHPWILNLCEYMGWLKY